MTLINLNKARKERARAEKQARASENVAKFGRSRTAKEAEKMRSDRAKAHIDQHQRDR